MPIVIGNSQNSISQEDVEKVLNSIYSVGDIHISTSDVDPSSKFGGTWELFGTGRTLVGVDTAQTEFNTVEKTGGNKSLQSHTHGVSITSNSTGAHTHSVSITSASAGSHVHNLIGGYDNENHSAWPYDGTKTQAYLPSISKFNGDDFIKSAGAHTHKVSGNTGSTGAHTHKVSGDTSSSGSGDAQNLQPYITVYMWKKTA